MVKRAADNLINYQTFGIRRVHNQCFTVLSYSTHAARKAMSTFLSYDTIQTLGESGEGAFRGNTTMHSSNTHRERLAASRDEDRAM